MVITYIKSKDQPGKGAKSCSWLAEQGKLIFPCPRSCLGICLARRVRQSHPASACSSPYSGGIWYLWDSSRFTRWRPLIYLNSLTRLGQSRVYRVTQLRTDGVHCRESICTGPVNLKVVLNGRCLSLQVTMDQLICASLSHTHDWYEVAIMWKVCMYVSSLHIARVMRINRVSLPILLVVS